MSFAGYNVRTGGQNVQKASLYLSVYFDVAQIVTLEHLILSGSLLVNVRFEHIPGQRRFYVDYNASKVDLTKHERHFINQYIDTNIHKIVFAQNSDGSGFDLIWDPLDDAFKILL